MSDNAPTRVECSAMLGRLADAFERKAQQWAESHDIACTDEWRKECGIYRDVLGEVGDILRAESEKRPNKHI